MSPKQIEEKIQGTISGWETLRPAKSFGGFTLAQFKEKTKACFDTRAQIDLLNQQLAAATTERDDADAAALEAVKLVVNSVKGDPAEGENGELYKALGYVRTSDRASGLHRGGGGAPAKPAGGG